MIRKLQDCFTENKIADQLTKRYDKKPNGRVVYSIPIFADFYLDINVIEPKNRL